MSENADPTPATLPTAAPPAVAPPLRRVVVVQTETGERRFELPSDLADDDSTIRSTIKTYFPELAAGVVQRSMTKDAAGPYQEITLTKVAGPKG